MKLHLGCGKKHIPGFIHVDLEDHPHVNFRVPVNHLDFAQDNTVELIYASHVLEHFGRHEIDQVLGEWFRVLRPEGYCGWRSPILQPSPGATRKPESYPN